MIVLVIRTDQSLAQLLFNVKKNQRVDGIY